MAYAAPLPSGTPLYCRLHRRVYKERGRAREQRCVECEGPALDWAQVHDTDGSDPWAHFQPMCRRCHFAYDEVPERSAPNLALARSPDAIAKNAASRRGKKMPPEQGAKVAAWKLGRKRGPNLEWLPRGS